MIFVLLAFTVVLWATFLPMILHDPWPVLRAPELVAIEVPVVTFDSKGFS